MLVFQTTLNVLGSVDLLPLTGVTFPFVSMGGSSMLSCWGLLAYLQAGGRRPYPSRRPPRLRLPPSSRRRPPVFWMNWESPRTTSSEREDAR